MRGSGSRGSSSPRAVLPIDSGGPDEGVGETDGDLRAWDDLAPPPAKPEGGPRFGRLLIHHNPFYIVSGALLLLGCYLIGADTPDRGQVLAPLIWLIVTVLCYELIVLGLGLWLSREPVAHTQRDAMQLLIVWLVLALDAAMLHHEVMVHHPAAGVALAAVAWAWGLVGLAAIARGLQLRLSGVMWGLLAADLTLVFAVSAWYRQIASSGYLPDLTEFRAIWLLGVWIALHALAPDWSRRVGRFSVLHGALLVLPCASVVAHMYVANWTFSRYASDAVEAYHLVPLLLGVAAIVARQRYWGIAIGLGLIAFAWSVFADTHGYWLDWPGMAVTIYIPGLALTGLAALLLWTWLHHRGTRMIVFGYLFALLAAWIHLPPMVERSIHRTFDWLRNLVPSGEINWGVWVIVAAFVLLALGAAVSVRSRGREKHDPAA